MRHICLIGMLGALLVFVVRQLPLPLERGTTGTAAGCPSFQTGSCEEWLSLVCLLYLLPIRRGFGGVSSVGAPPNK